VAEPWLSEVSQGNVDAAWDLFIDTYRPLILKTIHRSLSNHDDVLDVFAHVCGTLSANGLARLVAYHEQQVHTASFSTCLVVVVRNQVVYWIRKQSGRPRVRIPDHLSELESRVFALIFAGGLSHVEAYERVRAERAPDLTFSRFLKLLAEVYRAHAARPGSRPVYARATPDISDEAAPADERVAALETGARVRQALEILEPDDRLALQLFVLDEVAASDVARMLGWPNPKTVYNRVYRALAALRAHLTAEGITPEDA